MLPAQPLCAIGPYFLDAPHEEETEVNRCSLMDNKQYTETTQDTERRKCLEDKEDKCIFRRKMYI